LTLPLDESQPELTTPAHDITKHLIDGELIFSGKKGDLLANLPAIATQKRGGGLVVPIPRGVAEDLEQVAIVFVGETGAVVVLTSLVVAPQSVPEPGQRVGTRARAHLRFLAGEVRDELVDVLELMERRRLLVLASPIRARREPDGKRLGEVFDRVRLRIPTIQVFDEALARRIRAIEVGVGLGCAAKRALPELAPLQVVGVLQRVSRLVTEQAHALHTRAALHLEHHLPFEAHEPRMGQIERDADTGDAVGRAPFVAQPRVEAKSPKPRRIELFAEAFHAVFEPGVCDGEAELG
jgi:hypothetical protein